MAREVVQVGLLAEARKFIAGCQKSRPSPSDSQEWKALEEAKKTTDEDFKRLLAVIESLWLSDETETTRREEISR